jgi:hypothetical protein
MALLAPIIAGVCALLAGLGALIWMNVNQPVLQKSPAEEPEPEQGAEAEPSLEDIWRGRVKLPMAYQSISVHHE